MRRSDLEEALGRLAPKMPRHEFEATVDHALLSGGLRGAAPETAVWLSLVAYVRHTFTEYDSLLEEGYDQDSARFFVRADMEEKLRDWGCRRPLVAD